MCLSQSAKSCPTTHSRSAPQPGCESVTALSSTAHSACLGAESALRRNAARASASSSGLRLSMRSPASAMTSSRISASSRSPVWRSITLAVASRRELSCSSSTAARNAPSVGEDVVRGVIVKILHLDDDECKGDTLGPRQRALSTCRSIPPHHSSCPYPRFDWARVAGLWRECVKPG